MCKSICTGCMGTHTAPHSGLAWLPLSLCTHILDPSFYPSLLVVLPNVHTATCPLPESCPPPPVLRESKVLDESWQSRQGVEAIVLTAITGIGADSYGASASFPRSPSPSLLHKSVCVCVLGGNTPIRTQSRSGILTRTVMNTRELFIAQRLMDRYEDKHSHWMRVLSLILFLSLNQWLSAHWWVDLAGRAESHYRGDVAEPC